jgi:hypothetical protein
MSIWRFFSSPSWSPNKRKKREKEEKVKEKKRKKE